MGRSGGNSRHDAAQRGGGDERIWIAVLDGPVDLDHPCFTGATLSVIETQAGNAGDGAALAHGTHVASIIFGQPGSPVAGIAPRCSGLIVPIFSAGDSGGLGCSQLDLARAILLAIEHGAHIINISGGQLSNESEADAYLRDALAKAEAAGILVVAATGNDGCDCVQVPAVIDTVLAVGACSSDGTPLEFSNWGADYRSNGILAAGEAVLGATPGGGTVRRSGSSYAAPLVSGAAATLLSDQVRDGLDPRPLVVRTAILATATPCKAPDQQRCLAGRLNLTGAQQQLKEGRQDMDIDTSTSDLRQAERLGITPLSVPGRIAVTDRSAGIGPQSDDAVTPSDCGCGCGGDKKKDCGCGGKHEAPPQRVFALGQIGYDFGSEARRDSFRQFMKGAEPTDRAILDYLNPGPEMKPDVERLTWILKLDQTPIYALKPMGAFAFNGYAEILTAFKAQLGPSPAPASGGKSKKGDEEKSEEKRLPVDLFSVAGVATGSIRLMTGETVPILVPSSRGIIAWDIAIAFNDFLDRIDEEEDRDRTSRAESLRLENPDLFREIFYRLILDFKNLITRKYRNLGVLGRERALNFAAGSAYTVFQFLWEIIGLDLLIDDITVSLSPACRPGSECYDVQIRTFRQSDITAALRTFQFTLDVSDTIPVNIGKIAVWSERPNK